MQPLFILFTVLFTFCRFFFYWGCCNKFLSSGRLPWFLRTGWLIYGLAVAATTALQILIYTDGFVFKLFGFHFNGFVWNLISTEGGITSMGSSPSTVRSFIATGMFFLIAQGTILLLLTMVPRIKDFCGNFLTRRKLATATIILIVNGCFAGYCLWYEFFLRLQAYSFGIGRFSLLCSSSFDSIPKSLGIRPPHEASFRMKFSEIDLRYPLNPINQQANHKTYNIVFLMAESLRADMLDAQIMPQTWAFSQRSVRFKQHYSGGNGTRMSMFAAFYGLYGNYWFKCLEERRGPVWIDLLTADNYQMNMFSSAKFSYPEFDKTVFSQIPRDRLHDSKELEPGLLGWKLDRQNVERMLNFLENRDKSRPFMTFMFFESPHARYYFPPENEIRVPYFKEFNYATVDLEKDIQLIKNRYINSCNHLDSQFGRVLKYLEEKSLLDSTIVIITGDHGEEFMEKGRWGHNSTYSEEQTRVPMVLWVPGVEPHQVESITSHLDIPATVLNLLGVTNPPEEYSQGIDMLGKDVHQFTVISDWNAIVYVDNEYKATFPMNVFGAKIVTTKADIEIANRAAFYQSHKSHLVEVMKGLSCFSKQ